MRRIGRASPRVLREPDVRLLVGLLVAVILAVPSPVALAATRSVSIVFHYRNDPPLPTGASCPTRNGVPGFGVVNSAHSGLSGGDTWIGQSVVTDTTCIYLLPDGSLDYTGTEAGTVTLRGCGTGYIAFAYTGHASAPHIPSLLRDDHSDWQILPQSGTGPLAGLTGSGVADDQVRPDLTASGVGKGNALCRVPEAINPCLAQAGALKGHRIGLIAFGLRRRQLLRRVGVVPTRRTPTSYQWCVSGVRGRVAVIFYRGRAAAVATSVSSQRIGGVSPGSSLSHLRAAYPHLVKLGADLFRAAPGNSAFFLVAHNHIRLVGVAQHRLLSSPHRLLSLIRRAKLA